MFGGFSGDGSPAPQAARANVAMSAAALNRLWELTNDVRIMLCRFYCKAAATSGLPVVNVRGAVPSSRSRRAANCGTAAGRSLNASNGSGTARWSEADLSRHYARDRDVLQGEFALSSQTSSASRRSGQGTWRQSRTRAQKRAGSHRVLGEGRDPSSPARLGAGGGTMA